MFYCAKYGLPHLVESGGVLINTACTATARRCHALAAAICQHSLLSPSRIDNPPKCVAVGCCRYIVLPFIIFHQFNALRARVPTILMLPVQSVKVAFIEQGGDAGHITAQELLLPVSLHYNTTQAMPLNNTGTLHNTAHHRLHYTTQHTGVFVRAGRSALRDGVLREQGRRHQPHEVRRSCPG